MPDRTKLLTPDDKLVKKRLASKYHRIWNDKEIQKRLKMTCTHPSIYYSMKEQWFKCKKCDDTLVYCDFDSYRLFCGYLGIPLTKFSQ